MKRPTKKEIREAVQKLQDVKTDNSIGEPTVGKPEGKKANKNRIRKQGV